MKLFSRILGLALAVSVGLAVSLADADVRSFAASFLQPVVKLLNSTDITASTINGSDTKRICISGGGATNDGGRGAWICLNGSESSNGALRLGSGTGSGDAAIAAPTFYIQNGSANITWYFAANGDLIEDPTNGGNIIIQRTGKTLYIDSGTAASACAGTVTGTGTTAVTVATTCAATGARIFFVRTSAPSGTAQCWTDTIVNGTSFNFDCDGAETGTFAWWIQKEG